MADHCCGRAAAQPALEGARPIGILFAAGDIANCSSSRSRFRETADLLAAQIDAATVDGVPIRVLLLGDIAYASGPWSYQACLAEFDDSWGRFLQYFLPVPGNHDYSDDDSPAASTFFDYFSAFYESLDHKSANGSYLYVFPKGHPNAWALFALNFYRDRDAEFDFAEETLTKPDFGCRLAFTHPFYLSSGHHGRSQINFLYNRLDRFIEILLSSDASVLLTAHDHDFEQFGKIIVGGNVTDIGGVRLFVVGTGGAPLYPVPDDNRHPSSEHFQNSDHGILKIELYEDYYRWVFLPIDASTRESAIQGEDFCNRP